jgi:hypothetical protein
MECQNIFIMPSNRLAKNRCNFSVILPVYTTPKQQLKPREYAAIGGDKTPRYPLQLTIWRKSTVTDGLPTRNAHQQIDYKGDWTVVYGSCHLLAMKPICAWECVLAPSTWFSHTKITPPINLRWYRPLGIKKNGLPVIQTNKQFPKY